MTLATAAEITFLALAIWRESRGEPIETRIAIAQVAATRAKHPSWWGRDILSVLFRKWQFSSLTDPRDPQLTTWPGADDETWKECLQIAADTIAGRTAITTPEADHYHDISIPPPEWAIKEKYLRQIGRVRFYKLGP